MGVLWVLGIYMVAQDEAVSRRKMYRIEQGLIFIPTKEIIL